MRSRISSKGQITVPSEVREQLGLYAGTPVEFELRDGAVIVRKSIDGEHPVDRVYGRFELGATTDALLETLRGPGPEGVRRRSKGGTSRKKS